MAFNLNPSVPDRVPLADGGDRGLPRIVVQNPSPGVRRFRVVTMRRKMAPFLTYKLKASVNLSGFSQPNGVTTMVLENFTDYQRVAYTVTAPAGMPRGFAVFEVEYDP
jgi:hypothetical protein